MRTKYLLGKKSKKAFSLIELLVVIAIIGGLSAMLVPNFMGARERARDSQRKSDLKQIQKALELYKLDQAPVSYVASLSFPDPCTTWSSGSTVYMNSIPTDPQGTCTSTKKYYYQLNATDDLKYDLYACIENTADTDSNIEACPADFEDVTGYPCSTNNCYRVIQP